MGRLNDLDPNKPLGRLQRMTEESTPTLGRLQRMEPPEEAAPVAPERRTLSEVSPNAKRMMDASMDPVKAITDRLADLISRTPLFKGAAEAYNMQDEGKLQLSTFENLAPELLKGGEDPALTLLNTKTGAKVTGQIYDKTANAPIKYVMAPLMAMGDKTYEEAYDALMEKRNDPNNGRFEEILWGVQDSGVQSAIVALLSVGAAALSRNPKVGTAVAAPIFGAISAESQRRETGKVHSKTNIAIDTVGDTLISGLATKALNSFFTESGKTLLRTVGKNMGKGFLVEGTTEPTQTFLKYANDYMQADSQLDRENIVAKVTEYVKSGGMINEFLIGGISGALITGGATVAGSMMNKQKTAERIKSSEAMNVDKAIEAGDVAREAIYKEGEVLQPAFAKGRIDDVAQKLDQTMPGLGDKLRAEVDVNNTTYQNIVDTGLRILESAPEVDPNLIPRVDGSPKEKEETNSETEIADINQRISEINDLMIKLNNDPLLPATKRQTEIADLSEELAKLNAKLAQVASDTAAIDATLEADIQAANEERIRSLTLKPSQAATEEEQMAEIRKLFADGQIGKPLVQKSDIRTLIASSPEFKANPIMIVKEEQTSEGSAKYLTFTSEKQTFKLKASALGLQENNLKVGDEVRVDPATLKGKVQQMRVYDGTKVVASAIPVRGPRGLFYGSIPDQSKIEPSVVQYVQGDRLFFQTIPKGQLETFKHLIDDPQGGDIAGKKIKGKVWHLTAKTPAQMIDRGAEYNGTASIQEVKQAVESSTSADYSLASDLADGTAEPAKTVEEFIRRIEQLNKFGQSQAILRRTGGLPKKAAGMFRHTDALNAEKRGLPVKGTVHLQDSVVSAPERYMSVLAHELGHALEKQLTGDTNVDTFRVFGRDLSAEVKTTIRNELKEVTNIMVGKELAQKGAGYYYKNTELLARFLERMFTEPGTLGEMAPTALKYIEQSAIETPIIAEYLEAVYGNIDKGERKHILFRDMKQTYQKLLGTRVGTMAWNDEMRYRIMKERAKISIEKLVSDKFKKIKDEPSLLFQVAESIKVTRGGVPEYGTRDFKWAENDKEAAQLEKTGYKVIRNELGEVQYEVVDGKKKIRFAKDRYTPQQAHALFASLSPEGQELVKDFTAAREEAKDYFNREVIKAAHKITSDIEGWVHHYWEDRSTDLVGDKLKTKKASATKFRSGEEGYVQDLQKAMTKALTELETVKAYNSFIEDYFARVSRPIAEGAEPEEGWIEVQGNVKKAGIGRPQDSSTTVIKDGQAFVAKKVRYQMPALIYERYKMISEVAVEASTALRIVNSLNRYWKVNILFHPGSAATNFISGGIQYSSKVLTDFYTEVLTGNVAFEKTRRNVYAMLTVLTPKGWQAAPDWIYGGDTSNFYGQFGQEKAPGIKKLDTSVDAYADKALKLYGAVERYWKKVVATAEGVSDLESLGQLGPDGLRLPTEEEKAMLDEINSEIDLFAYDYDNVPVWMEKYQQSASLQTIKPFMKYPYKYLKHVTEMATGIFDQTTPWQERVAKLMALGTLVALYALIRGDRREKQTTPEVDESAPTQVSTRGRFFIGKDESGKEKFIRVSKYPFVNLTETALQFIDGNTNTGAQSLRDMIGSVGAGGEMFAAILGYSNEYQTYVPITARLGDASASFVPGTRILADVARFFDPYQRKKEGFTQAFTSLVPIPTDSESLREKLRGEARTIQVPLEGGVRRQPGEKTTRTTTDQLVENYKTDILAGLLGGIYTTRISPMVAEAFVKRRAENDAEKAKRDAKEAARKARGLTEDKD